MKHVDSVGIVRGSDSIPPHLYALTFCDPNTGVVLNEDGQWATNDDQAITVFATLEAARRAAQSAQDVHPSWECHISGPGFAGEILWARTS